MQCHYKVQETQSCKEHGQDNGEVNRKKLNDKVYSLHIIYIYQTYFKLRKFSENNLNHNIGISRREFLVLA